MTIHVKSMTCNSSVYKTLFATATNSGLSKISSLMSSTDSDNSIVNSLFVFITMRIQSHQPQLTYPYILPNVLL